MTHRIIQVNALEEYIIIVVFQNGVEKKYDMCQLFSTIPQFEMLTIEPGLFEQVRVDVGGYGVSWNDELDLSAEEIWQNGVTTGKTYEFDIRISVGNKLTNARELVGMKQTELAEATGIYQADISKIERGLANPSLLTLERLADGMGMKLNIEFIKK